MESLPTVDEALRELGDVYLHSGDIEPPADELLIQHATRPRGDRASLFLCTLGGYPNSAYRMIRCLRHAYPHVTVVIAGPCKSAGTLLALGADQLVMTGNAELGPLDVQLPKENELFERQSALATSITFDVLTEEVCKTFVKTYSSMQRDAGLSSALAAETAERLTSSMFSPIFGQIDPIRVSEGTMANLLARRYAEALLKHNDHERRNTTSENIVRLVYQYPAHGYAIDRTEAMQIFENVRKPDHYEQAIIDELATYLRRPAGKPITLKLPKDNHEDATHEPDPTSTRTSEGQSSPPDSA